MENKVNYYAIIPANVRYDSNISANAKLLYGEITSLCDKKGICWATNDYFAKLYGVTKKSISVWLSQLINAGYVKSKIIYKGDSKEVESRLLSIEEKVNTYGRKSNDPMEENFSDPMEEKVKDNNTSNTNIINEYKKEIYKEKFEKFWKLYPRKVNKFKTEEWFKKNNPGDKLFDVMMKRLQRYNLSEEWAKENGKYIPYPTTWLNQKRWEDDVELKNMFKSNSQTYVKYSEEWWNQLGSDPND